MVIPSRNDGEGPRNCRLRYPKHIARDLASTLNARRKLQTDCGVPRRLPRLGMTGNFDALPMLRAS
jgi:hypothetical protein